MDYSYLVPAGSVAFGESIHMMIASKGGVAGLIIELVRSIGNLLLNVGEMAKQFTKLYAISAAGSILSDHYLTYLETGNGIKTKDYWIFYSDNGEIAVKYLLNLFVLRITGEEQMKETNDKNTIFIQWLYEDILFSSADCQRNIDECKARIAKY